MYLAEWELGQHVATVVVRKVNGNMIAGIYGRFVPTSILLGLWLAVVPTICLAEDQPGAQPYKPSLDETLDWLITKIDRTTASVPVTKDAIIVKAYNLGRVEDERCQLEFEEQMRVMSLVTPFAQDSSMIIPLSALGANTVTLSVADKPGSSSTVTASCVKGSCITGISRTTKADKSWEEWKPAEHSEVIIAFREKSVAERVQTALTHAIILCGGQKEPF